MSEEEEIEPTETVGNLGWLQQIAKEKLDKYSRGTAFQEFAKEILEKLGFTNIGMSVHGLDWDAKKDGKPYVIEVKGTETGGDVVIKWSQLERLWDAGLEGTPMLMFVNKEGKWSLYELFNGCSPTKH